MIVSMIVLLLKNSSGNEKVLNLENAPNISASYLCVEWKLQELRGHIVGPVSSHKVPLTNLKYYKMGKGDI